MFEVEICDRLSRQSAKFSAQSNYVPAFARVVPIGQKDNKRFGKRIDPDRRPGPSCMSVRPKREKFPARSAITRIYIPSDSAPVTDRRRRLHGRYQADGLRLEDA